MNLEGPLLCCFSFLPPLHHIVRRSGLLHLVFVPWATRSSMEAAVLGQGASLSYWLCPWAMQSGTAALSWGRGSSDILVLLFLGEGVSCFRAFVFLVAAVSLLIGVLFFSKLLFFSLLSSHICLSFC